MLKDKQYFYKFLNNNSPIYFINVLDILSYDFNLYIF